MKKLIVSLLVPFSAFGDCQLHYADQELSMQNYMFIECPKKTMVFSPTCSANQYSVIQATEILSPQLAMCVTRQNKEDYGKPGIVKMNAYCCSGKRFKFIPGIQK